MKRILFVLPTIALLGGCGAGGFIEQQTGLTPAQQRQAVVGGLRSVSCLIAAQGGFGSLMVQTDSAFACSLAGGTVAR
jgi:hypothetical protein